VFAPEAVLADQSVHGRASEIERARGLGDVPVVLGQRAEQQLLLVLAHGVVKAAIAVARLGKTAEAASEQMAWTLNAVQCRIFQEIRHPGGPGAATGRRTTAEAGAGGSSSASCKACGRSSCWVTPIVITETRGCALPA